MTIKNADKSAMPNQALGTDGLPTHEAEFGLTKRETFCLHMGVAETGDEELDSIIRNGNRQKIAASVMHGLIDAPKGKFDHDNAEDAMRDAIVIADALLAELERTK